MRKTCLAVALTMTIAWANAASAQNAQNRNALLRGTFSITGNDMCLYSPAGFNTNFTPISPPASRIFLNMSVLGTWIFDGDGTGHGEMTFENNPTAPPLGSPMSSHVTLNFTYDVGLDNAVTIENPTDEPLTGTVLTGPAAGADFTVDHVITTGKLSLDHRSLTQAAPEEPQIEVFDEKSADGTTTLLHSPRICTRSRILIKVSGESQ